MAEKSNYIIRNAHLIDGTGRNSIEGANILVKDGKITEISQDNDYSFPESFIQIDATNLTLMPGLIDSHMHFSGWKTDNVIAETHVTSPGLKLMRSVTDARNLLKAGFTTVRDCGGEDPFSIAIALKHGIEEGHVNGPRVLASGWLLCVTGGHDDFHYLPLHWAKEINPCICDGVPECMKAARYALRQGADFIKVCSTGGVMSQRDSPDQTQFTMEELKAIVEIADNAGTFVSTHAQGTKGINQSIEAGIRTIEHANSPDDTSIELGLKNNTVFVPTLAVVQGILAPENQKSMPPWAITKANVEWEKMKIGLQKLHEAGVILAMGTDYLAGESMKHGTNAVELELLVKYGGLSPMDAIKAATWGGAHACALQDKIGTIEKGKLADLILVNGNPLTDISLLQDVNRIKLVMREGEVVINTGLKYNG
jgi:imidazolonepropionase-like amidohydrolase